MQLREAQSEAGRTAIAGALRITSALTLIDEGAKEELREGRNGAPVSGGGLRQRRWSGTQYLNLEDHLRGYFVSPLLPPLLSSLPSSQHLSEVDLDALDQFYNLVDPASTREKAEE